MKKYEPILTICKDCGKNFTITIEEQRHFKSLGFELPKRCQNCRRKRKEVKKAAKAEERKRKEAFDKEEKQKNGKKMKKK